MALVELGRFNYFEAQLLVSVDDEDLPAAEAIRDLPPAD